MSTPGDLTQDPLARAVLAKLADTRGEDTALGSFARTVLAGRVSLREAAANPWHGEALQQALTDAAQAQRDMPAEQRADFEHAAQRLRDPDHTATSADRTSGHQARDGVGG